MQRIHMNYISELPRRLRCGESKRQIARDLGVSRPTVHKYKVMADTEGLLDGGKLPDPGRLAAVLGPAPQPPKIPSTLEPYWEMVERMLDQGVEMTAMLISRPQNSTQNRRG